MKRKLIAAFIVCCTFFMYSSCYKTGEVIPQTTCKPDSIVITRTIYNFLNFFDFTMLQTFNGTLKYDANRRLIGGINQQNGSPVRQFEFIYDVNNNLIRINDYSINQGNSLSLVSYYLLSYPSGTIGSISTTAQVQLFIVDDVNHIIVPVPVWTYNFNAQFQLVSIFQGAVKLEQLTYDFGGNCQTDSVYTQGGQLSGWYLYSSYDNGINPARSDRSLQLFFQMYNKNNPTNTIHFAPAVGAPNIFVIDKSSTGNYLYNLFNYPTVYAGSLFAQYNCQVPPPPQPIPFPGQPN
jgi:hypothetical protein